MPTPQREHDTNTPTHESKESAIAVTSTEDVLACGMCYFSIFNASMLVSGILLLVRVAHKLERY